MKRSKLKPNDKMFPKQINKDRSSFIYYLSIFEKPFCVWYTKNYLKEGENLLYEYDYK